MITDKALFLYGFDISLSNKYINFKNASLGNEITAVLPIGNYTCTELLFQIKKAMDLADGVNKYTVSINRGIDSGESNRVSISTNGSYLELLFNSGTNAANSVASLIGFDLIDYTGGLSYTGYKNAGIILLPDFPTYNYLSPDSLITNDGVKNVTASGIKETLVFSQMYFFEGQWKWIANRGGNLQLTQWQSFLKYATKQFKLEFSPSIYEDSSLFYQCTLETTPADGNGLGYRLNLMNGLGLYRFYETGTLKFRLLPS